MDLVALLFFEISDFNPNPRFLFFSLKGSIKKKNVCMYLFIYLAALGLRCCMWAFSSCGEQGLLFTEVCRLLIAVASLVAEHRF